jgi:hypothetical protein
MYDIMYITLYNPSVFSGNSSDPSWTNFHPMLPLPLTILLCNHSSRYDDAERSVFGGRHAIIPNMVTQNTQCSACCKLIHPNS